MALTQALWTPTPAAVEASNLHDFESFLSSTRGLVFADYQELWRWSTTEIADFWVAVWEYFGLHEVTGHDEVLESADMPGARWFPGARLNFAERILAPGDPEDEAIVDVDEAGRVRTVTRAELREQSHALAATLRERGVGPGDVVVGYLPNVAESVVAFLATALLGATWSSVGQDYAPGAARDRFAQLRPVALIAADGYRFAGAARDKREDCEELRRGLQETLTVQVMVSAVAEEPATGEWLTWAAATRPGPQVQPVAMGFDDPLWVLFSSGTTGLPKGLVHSHGGALLEHLKVLALHMDVRPGDRFFWHTTPSWMLWNLQLSALALGASIVCYSGSPGHPDPTRLWQVVADVGVTFFGTSPGYLQASKDHGVQLDTLAMDGLRLMGSTGSPLSPDVHRWAAEELPSVPLLSTSGGTDIVSAFCGGAPTAPAWPGELSIRNLGVAMEAWNDQGEPVVGEVGELVVTAPMPSMPVTFWDDPDGQRYRDAYYSTFPGVWRHGDWVTITERGSVIVHGRSDSTLNRHGVRMGSADIYAAVEALDEVAEALVVGVEYQDGSYWMPLFVALHEGHRLEDSLVRRIRAVIKDEVSPRHVPDEILAVDGIPHTRTGKKLEVPVKRVLQGHPASQAVNRDAVDRVDLFDALIATAADRRPATTSLR